MAGLLVRDTVCKDSDVTYWNRVDDPEHYNYCVVPDAGYDAIVFASVALLFTCIVSARLSAVWVLIAGALCEVLSYNVNLGRLGNSVAIWLGMQPAEVFLYIFLPPLLLDSAVRLDFFIFRKVLVLALVFAFVMVAASTFLAIPVMLYGLGLAEVGWNWLHAALFAAMVASTDAVAVSANLKAGGAPEQLSALLEGESLFNDASGLVLFDIFLKKLAQVGEKAAQVAVATAAGTASAATTAAVAGLASEGDPPGSLLGLARSTGGDVRHGWEPYWPTQEAVQAALHELLTVLKEFTWLVLGGVLIGFLFGTATTWLLKLVQWRRQKPAAEVTVTLACAYLCFYIANAPCATSGVIAVVVYGLYGAWSMQWELSSRAKREGSFIHFWDVVSFAMNGLIFFFVGASSANFLSRTARQLTQEGPYWALYDVGIRLPLIYLAFTALRFVLIGVLAPLMRLLGSDVYLPWQGVVFATVGGLRGAVSLILAQSVLALQSGDGTKDGILDDKTSQRVTAQMVLWTAGFVLMTLLIHAPLMTPLMAFLGLNRTSAARQQVRSKAKQALLRYSRSALGDLRNETDEMLRGVDWAAVERFVDLSGALDKVFPEYQGVSPWMPKHAHRDADGASSVSGGGRGHTAVRPLGRGQLPGNPLGNGTTTGCGSTGHPHTQPLLEYDQLSAGEDLDGKQAGGATVPLLAVHGTQLHNTGSSVRASVGSHIAAGRQKEAIGGTNSTPANSQPSFAGGVADGNAASLSAVASFTSSRSDNGPVVPSGSGNSTAASPRGGGAAASGLVKRRPSRPLSRQLLQKSASQHFAGVPAHAAGRTERQDRLGHRAAGDDEDLPAVEAWRPEAFSAQQRDQEHEDTMARRLVRARSMMLDAKFEALQKEHQDDYTFMVNGGVGGDAGGGVSSAGPSGEVGHQVVEVIVESLWPQDATTPSHPPPHTSHLPRALSRHFTPHGAEASCGSVFSRQPPSEAVTVPSAMGLLRLTSRRRRRSSGGGSEGGASSGIGAQRNSRRDEDALSAHVEVDEQAEQPTAGGAGDAAGDGPVRGGPPARRSSLLSAVAQAGSDGSQAGAEDFGGGQPPALTEEQERVEMALALAAAEFDRATSTHVAGGGSPQQHAERGATHCAAAAADDPAAGGEGHSSGTAAVDGSDAGTDGSREQDFEDRVASVPSYSEYTGVCVLQGATPIFGLPDIASVPRTPPNAPASTVSPPPGSAAISRRTSNDAAMHELAGMAVVPAVAVARNVARPTNWSPFSTAEMAFPEDPEAAMLHAGATPQHSHLTRRHSSSAAERSHRPSRRLGPPPTSASSEQYRDNQACSATSPGAAAATAAAAVASSDPQPVLARRSHRARLDPFLVVGQDCAAGDSEGKGTSFRVGSPTVGSCPAGSSLVLAMEGAEGHRGASRGRQGSAAMSWYRNRAPSLGGSSGSQAGHGGGAAASVPGPAPTLATRAGASSSSLTPAGGGSGPDKALSASGCIGSATVAVLRGTSISASSVAGLARTSRLAAGQSTAVEPAPVWELMSNALDLEGLGSEGGRSNAMLEEAAAEFRIRVLSGFKRYFHAKHIEGLLSSRGLRVLDFSCDTCLETPSRPLDLWRVVQSEVEGQGAVQWQAWLHFALRYQINTMRRSRLWGTSAAENVLAWIANGLGKRLSRVMMTGLEVALELWLALTSSPQAQWVEYAGASGVHLQKELHQQADMVWRFIIDREIEAPDRFHAIQSHRAAMAVLRQQEAFVAQLFESGALDEAEREAFSAPIERRMWRLEVQGPRWRHPSLVQTLQNVPFLQNASPQVFEWLRAHGELVSYSKGQTIMQRGHEDLGLFIVVAGIVRIVLEPEPLSVSGVAALATSSAATGATVPPATEPGESFYVGVGGVGGLLVALIGRGLQGLSIVAAYAEGNALGRGPVLFHVPRATIGALRAKARQGEREFQELELSMFRFAGVLILDKQRQATISNIVSALVASTVAAEEQLGPGKRSNLRNLIERTAEQNLERCNKRGRAVIDSVFDQGDGWRDDGTASESSSNTDISLGGSQATLGSGHLAGADEKLMRRCVDRALEIFEAMRRSVQRSHLVILAPRQSLTQRSTMILVGGSIIQKRPPHTHAGDARRGDATGHEGGVAGGVGATGEAPTDSSTGHSGLRRTVSSRPSARRPSHDGSGMPPGHVPLPVYKPPATLMWLPAYFEYGIARYFRRSGNVEFVAGPLGATLLVCDVDAHTEAVEAAHIPERDAD